MGSSDPEIRRGLPEFRERNHWMWTKRLVTAPVWQRAATILALLGVVYTLTFVTRSTELENRRTQVVASVPYHPGVTLAVHEEPLPETVALPQPFALRRGQTPAHLLRELGVGGSENRAAVAALGEHVDLRKIRAGEAGFAYFDPLGELVQLRLELSRKGWVTLERSDEGGWTSSMREYRRAVSRRAIEGRLETFLFADIERAGGATQVAYAMSDVMQWDLDFNRDLRRGDFFQVLYEEITLDGRFAEVGRAQALVYENRGVHHEAYLFGDSGEEGYYDASGRPLQKMFLRSPLPFTRVTSRFSHRRYHPVLKRYRPHYGVDFGAPKGTPVRATATGTVTFAGRSGGAGKMVKLRHPNSYETLYLHLSGFARGVRKGSKVRQGDVVGYVGSTGLSTGPHLDYRVKKGGRYLDPMKLENRPAEPIAESRMAEFLELRDRLRDELGYHRDRRAEVQLARLDQIDRTELERGGAAGL